MRPQLLFCDRWIIIKLMKEIEKSLHDYLDYLELHIHSEKNLEGAGWDHGKLGSGTTIFFK